MKMIVRREERIQDKARRNINSKLYYANRDVYEARKQVERAIDISDKHNRTEQSNKLKQLLTHLEDAFEEANKIRE